MNCDREIPIRRDGARFTCVVTLSSGATQTIAYAMDREGRLTAIAADGSSPASGPSPVAGPSLAADPGPAAPEPAADPDPAVAPDPAPDPRHDGIRTSGDPWSN
jgi:hypothetical protein